ncbi:MAG: hypothetical protein HDR88_03540 [Bacteroides sp.]|nr:hypothetical protein [Bacteroides sp.]
MNKPIKILLLIAAVIIAISGVLLYMKTIVSPPRDLEFKNQFEEALNQKIECFKKVDSDNLEREFTILTDLAHRFKAESNIDEKFFDKEYTEIIGIYSPKFTQYCLGQFQKSVWNESEHKWMEDRIAQLRKLTVEDGSRKIMENFSEADSRLSIILKTISKYRGAKALSNRTGYSSLGEARSRISEANQYKQDEYLKNNTALMIALNGLPGRLESSHYASVRTKVNALANYYNYSQDSYDALSDNVVAAIKEYKQNAQSVYGTSRSLSDLEADAARYYDAAIEYYENY